MRFSRLGQPQPVHMNSPRALPSAPCHRGGVTARIRGWGRLSLLSYSAIHPPCLSSPFSDIPWWTMQSRSGPSCVPAMRDASWPSRGRLSSLRSPNEGERHNRRARRRRFRSSVGSASDRRVALLAWFSLVPRNAAGRGAEERRKGIDFLCSRSGERWAPAARRHAGAAKQTTA